MKTETIAIKTGLEVGRICYLLGKCKTFERELESKKSVEECLEIASEYKQTSDREKCLRKAVKLATEFTECKFIYSKIQDIFPGVRHLCLERAALYVETKEQILWIKARTNDSILLDEMDLKLIRISS